MSQLPRTIALLGFVRTNEFVANAALSPGHLLERLSTGKIQKHSTEGGYGTLWLPFEDALQGKSVDDAYAANDIVRTGFAQPGDIGQALLKPGVAYAVGDKLISAGDGTLKKQSAATTTTVVKKVLGEIYVAKDLSATGAVAALGQVMAY